MTKNSNSHLGMAARGGVDRLSNLPDPIIHHILSFLDTKSVVKTCVLSKQWECTWKHVHTLNLNLYFSEFERYETFVEKVLSLRYPLHVGKVIWSTFSYSDAPDGCEFYLLKRVVQYAVSHGAQHFCLQPRNYYEPYISLLKLFYSIPDIVRTLELVRFDIDCRPVCSRFQLLTTLKLVSCRFLTDRELFDPFSQFPCLNHLVLRHCSWASEGGDHQPVRLRVSGLELGRLSLLAINVWKLEIFAPKLKYLKLSTREIMEFSELTLPSLVHADITNHWGYSDDNDYAVDEEHLVIMSHGIHNVEYLTLCKEINEEVRRKSRFLELQDCPFPKLKKLILKCDSDEEIPYKVMNHYFFNGSSDIQIRKAGIYQVVIMQRLS